MIYPHSGYITVVLCNRGYPLAHNILDFVLYRTSSSWLICIRSELGRAGSSKGKGPR
jgi:hypothetical protein